MHLVRDSPPTRDLARRFGHTLIPIGLAYVTAHFRGIAVYGDSRRASLSQRWMLLVMVGFTCLGLFLLSQSNG